jgi:DNA-binding NarL/FixJ family response regulator
LVLIESLPLYLDGLAAMLMAAWPSLDLARSSGAADGLAHLRARAADAVLVDLASLEDEGIALEDMVEAAQPGAVIVTDAGVEPRRIAAAIASGARGYIPKTMIGEAIRGAIVLVLSGGACFPTQALPELRAVPHARDRLPRNKRELEILARLDRGHSNKTIARELGVSVATVKLHVQSILRTTGARNRVEATLNARRMGILPPAR